MNLLHRLQLPTILGVLFSILFFSSCEEDLTTIGANVIGGEPFSTGVEVYDVFASNNKIEAVQTNKLSVYQLGTFNDPIYGKTEAQITAQMQLATGSPSFGTYSQSAEDASDTDDSIFTIEEEENVTAVYLYIPYLTKTSATDSDGDGLAAEFDADDDDVDSDTDGDGRTDLEEAASGTDPLNASSVDDDLDGVNDTDGVDIIANNFAKQIDIDSIYGGNVGDSFKLTVKRSTYYLRDYDAETNFTEAQNYYSDQDYSSFVDETLADEEVVISDVEHLIVPEDDEDTEDVDESETFTHLNPGIRIPLDISLFQEIVDKEGSAELSSQTSFKEYIRGLHMSLTGNDKDIMVLLDLSKATIVMSYSYRKYNSNSTTDDTTDDTIETETTAYTFSLLGTSFTGNAVNTFINEAYPMEISNAFVATDEAEKIYLKGGSGTYAAIDLFSQDSGISTSIIDEIKANNWIINEAKLVFYVDETANQLIEAADVSESSIKPPRLYLFNTETNAGIYNATNEYSLDTTSPFGIFLNYDGFLEESDSGDIYTVRITDHINDIIVRDSVNRTLGLTITPNINISGALNAKVTTGDQELPAAPIVSPLGTVLHANHPSSEDLKLKLEIHYSEAN